MVPRNTNRILCPRCGKACSKLGPRSNCLQLAGCQRRRNTGQSGSQTDWGAVERHQLSGTSSRSSRKAKGSRVPCGKKFTLTVWIRTLAYRLRLDGKNGKWHDDTQGGMCIETDNCMEQSHDMWWLGTILIIRVNSCSWSTYGRITHSKKEQQSCSMATSMPRASGASGVDGDRVEKSHHRSSGEFWTFESFKIWCEMAWQVYVYRMLASIKTADAFEQDY